MALDWDLGEGFKPEPPPSDDEELQPIVPEPRVYGKWGLTDNLQWYVDHDLPAPFTDEFGRVHGTPNSGTTCAKKNGKICEPCRKARNARNRDRQGGSAREKTIISPAAEQRQPFDSGNLESEIREWLTTGADATVMNDPVVSKIAKKQAPKIARDVRRVVDRNEWLAKMADSAAPFSPYVKLAVDLAPLVAAILLTWGIVTQKNGGVFTACTWLVYKAGITEDELFSGAEEVIEPEPEQGLWGEMPTPAPEETAEISNGHLRIGPSVG